MSLQAAFRSVQSALASNAFQAATVSRNMSGADAPGYSRKIVLVEPAQQGQSPATRIMRTSDASLQSAALDARATVQRNEEISRYLEALQKIVGEPADETSPAARLVKLKTALLTAAASPQDQASLLAAVNSAKSVASCLNEASAAIQKARSQADSDMGASIARVNALLENFGTINATIVSGQSTGGDVSDALDRRDAILADLSKEIAISTVSDLNGEMSIYTDTGVALFQRTARTVSMEATPTCTASIAGQSVYIDGVAVTGPSAAPPLHAGAISGLSQFRDEISVAFQLQIDELAVGLISAFSQASQAPGNSTSRTGLFTWSGAPALAPSGLAALASEIRVDSSVEQDPALLRDGGIGGSPDHIYNSGGSVSYSSRLYALVDALGAPQNVSASSLPSRLSVNDTSLQSQAWLEGVRQQANEESTNSNAVLTQATAALSNATGVSIDDQMSKMLDLENSYQAAAKMMASIDSMYAALFSSIQSA